MTGGSPEVVGQEEIIARLDSYYKINVCGNRKEALILVEIGPVARSDSLIGFDFEVSFDSTKFKFSPVPITISTMAEFFEFVNIRQDPLDKSILTGYGVNLSFRPVAGNGRLIGFIGDYIGPECPDTSIINFVSINFNEEFKREVVGYEDGVVVSYIKDDDMLLYVDILSDSLKFKDTTTVELIAEIVTSDTEKLDFAEFEIEVAAAANYDISEVNPISGDIEISEFSKLNGKYYFRVDFAGAILGNQKIALIVNEVKKDSIVTSLTINPIKVNECACITNLEGDSSFLESFKAATDTTTAVADNREEKDKIEAYYDSYSNKIVVKSENNLIYKVRIYDLQGRLAGSFGDENYNDENYRNGNYSNYVEYESDHLGRGVYILVVTQSNMKIYKIVLVIN